MNSEIIIQNFRKSGALLEGHFLLTSGRHSDKYFEKFALLSQPKIVEELCDSIAKYFKDKKVEIVVGAATGGILLAYEVGKKMSYFQYHIDSVLPSFHLHH